MQCLTVRGVIVRERRIRIAVHRKVVSTAFTGAPIVPPAILPEHDKQTPEIHPTDADSLDTDFNLPTTDDELEPVIPTALADIYSTCQR